METQGAVMNVESTEFRGPGALSRSSLPLLAGGLLLALLGDRGVLTATSRGIDPLEILNLQVKPNVIVVLDSSGSMSENLTSGDITGDYSRSKMSLAKDVLTQAVTDNADKVNFLFGQYNQGNTSMSNSGPGADRFYYVADSYTYPNMTSVEVSLSREPGTDSTVTISAGVNDQFQFLERVASSPRTYVDCSFTVPAGNYLGDTDMVNLAAYIQVRLTNPYPADVTCTKYPTSGGSANNAQNSYAFTWDMANQRFRIGRSAGSNYYQLRFGAANSAGGALGFASNLPNTLTPPPINSTTWNNSNWSATTSGSPYNGSPRGILGGNSRGFEAWRDIRPAWNTFYFREGTQDCSFTIDTPPSPPGIYVRGALFAQQVQDKMNGAAGNPNPCGSLSPRNTYSVSYVNGQFQFRRVVNNQQATLQWGSQTTNSVRAALNADNGGFNDWGFGNANAPNCPGGTANGTFCTRYIPLLRRFTGNDPVTGVGFKFTENYDPDGTAGPALAQNITTYYLRAGKFFNGEIFQVTGSGGLCGMSMGTARVPPAIPEVTLQQVDTCGGSVENTVVFKWAGARFGGGACGGFTARVPLGTCDQAGSIQLSAISPFLAKQDIFNADGTITGYAEDMTAGYAGGFRATSYATNVSGSTANGGIRATGYTPIANSLMDIKTKFADLWNNGQASPPLDPISVHTDPKERTIVLFVTDGDDTCPTYNGGGNTSNMDDSALRAAYKAQLLHQRINAAEAASSVVTYVVGFGSGASTDRLNWIAWGGSGMTWSTSNGPDNAPSYPMRWASTGPTQAQKDAQCPTCNDAYIAPTPEALADIIQAIINQGAQFGDFTAQASRVTSVYEYASEVPGGYTVENGAGSLSRYEGLVPVLFRSTFTMPSYQGHVYAITNEAGTALTRWDAGERLTTRVQTGMAACDDNSTNGGQCIFSSMLDGNAGNGEIARRIYTTSRNGVFSTSLTDLSSSSWVQSNGNRTALWPPASGVSPSSGNGLLDAALGLPMADDDAAWTELTTIYKACLGANAPAACAGTNSQRVPQARKEARQMILSFAASANLTVSVRS